MRNIALSLLSVVATSAPTNAFAKPEGRTLQQELKSLQNRFDRLDTNKDKKIDQAELRVDNERIAARDGKPVASGKGGTLGSNNDTGGDGMVSMAEAERAVRAQFAVRDADKDGVVTEAEKAAARGD